MDLFRVNENGTRATLRVADTRKPIPKLLKRRLVDALGRSFEDILRRFHASSVLKAIEFVHSVQLPFLVAGSVFRYPDSFLKKLFKVALFNLGQAVSFYKDFTNIVSHHLFSTENTHLIKCGNPFRSVIQRIFGLELRAKLYLTQSRMLPPPDSKMTVKAQQEFKKVLTMDRDINPLVFEEFRYHIRRTLEGNITPTSKKSSLSLPMTGSFFCSVEEGGRLREIRDGFLPFLMGRPNRDEHYTFDSRSTVCPSGYRRLFSFCILPLEAWVEDPFSCLNYLIERDEEFPIPLVEATESKLIAILSDVLELDQEGYALIDPRYDDSIIIPSTYYTYSGVDGRVLSNQLIRWCAFEAREDLGFVRSSPVLEDGGKVRMITMATAPVITVQAVVGDYLQRSIGNIPEVKGIFTRGNLGWYTFASIMDWLYTTHEDVGRYEVLVSDFKSATDTLEFRLIQVILEELFLATGLHGDLATTALRTCSREKTVFIGPVDRPSDVFVSKRGVFMGEPMAKPVLTVFMASLRRFTLCSALRKAYRPEKALPFFYRAPGDDHISIAPRFINDAFESCSLRLGAMPQRAKLFRSLLKEGRYIKFVEEIFKIVDPLGRTDFKGVFQRSFLLSRMWFDHVKLKLFSRISTRQPGMQNYHLTVFSKGGGVVKQLAWNKSLSDERKHEIRSFYFNFFGYPELNEVGHPSRLLALISTKLGGWGFSFDQNELYEEIALGADWLLKILISAYHGNRISLSQIERVRGFSFPVGYAIPDHLLIASESLRYDMFYMMAQKSCLRDLKAVFQGELEGYESFQLPERLGELGWFEAKDIKSNFILDEAKNPLLTDIISIPDRPAGSLLRRLEALQDYAKQVNEDILDSLSPGFLEAAWLGGTNEYLYFPETLRRYYQTECHLIPVSIMDSD